MRKRTKELFNDLIKGVFDVIAFYSNHWTGLDYEPIRDTCLQERAKKDAPFTNRCLEDIQTLYKVTFEGKTDFDRTLISQKFISFIKTNFQTDFSYLSLLNDDTEELRKQKINYLLLVLNDFLCLVHKETQIETEDLSLSAKDKAARAALLPLAKDTTTYYLLTEETEEISVKEEEEDPILVSETFLSNTDPFAAQRKKRKSSMERFRNNAGSMDYRLNPEQEAEKGKYEARVKDLESFESQIRTMKGIRDQMVTELITPPSVPAQKEDSAANCIFFLNSVFIDIQGFINDYKKRSYLHLCPFPEVQRRPKDPYAINEENRIWTERVTKKEVCPIYVEEGIVYKGYSIETIRNDKNHYTFYLMGDLDLYKKLLFYLPIKLIIVVPENIVADFNNNRSFFLDHPENMERFKRFRDEIDQIETDKRLYPYYIRTVSPSPHYYAGLIDAIASLSFANENMKNAFLDDFRTLRKRMMTLSQLG